MQIQFYPYDFEYNLIDGIPYLYLFSKLLNGKKVCIINQYNPYLYAKFHEVDQKIIEKKLKELRLQNYSELAFVTEFEIVEKELIGKKEKFWKIYVNYPKAVPLIAKELENAGVSCYEKDILFVHRYLRDQGLIPLSLASAEGTYLEKDSFKSLRAPVFKAEKVYTAEKATNPAWRILSIDIETYAEKKEIDFEKNPILMVAFYGSDEQNNIFRKVITWKNFEHKLDFLEIVENEKEMLQRFKEVILDYSPEILVGYYSDGFDLPYLRARAKKNKIKLDIGIDGSELLSSGFGDDQIKIKGIFHLDVLKFIRNIFGRNLKTDSYDLSSVAEELLGYRKYDVNLDDLSKVWDNNPNKLKEFCEYNLHDAYLAHQLAVKLFPDMIEFTGLTGLPTFDVIRMSFSRLVESYIMKRAMEFNVLAPNKPINKEIEERMSEHIQGAFVYEPIPGIYKDIVVFDFRSLYPSIITAHNIGPESFRCDCCKNTVRVPELNDYWFCKKEKKFIPLVLEQLVSRRAEVKKMLKEKKKNLEDVKLLEARTYALKLLSNSFYGYLGFFGARWYCLECAASTTAYARNYIRKTMDLADKEGLVVIYADTDSCFVILNDKTKEQAKEFMDKVNYDLPGQMELEYEGYYPRGLFVPAKGSEKGAKKKYALLREDNSLKITGFETIRRNSSTIAKEVQEKVLRLVLEDKKEEAINYIKNRVKDLKDGNIPLNKLIIKTRISRELSSYHSLSPHVSIAKKLVEKGIQVNVGTVIEYIVASGKGLIRNRAKLPNEVKGKEYDYEYYLKNQLIPAVSGIFSVLGYTEEALFKETSQSKLGRFF